MINKSKTLQIKGACANNLKNINIDFPIGVLVGVKGVSGSGKSSLIRNVVYESSKVGKAVNCESIIGLEQFEQVVWVNQNTIKAGGQSYVASILNYYDRLKKPFLTLDKTKEFKLSASHFSLNGKDGCCKDCNGKGFISTALDFLSNVDEVCESCSGQGFNTQVLSCRWKNLSMADVLKLPLVDLASYYSDELVKELSELSQQIGLGYLSSGQMLKTLSGGELQRIKLLQALLESNHKNNLYLFDEPTMGLHLQDVERLLETFNTLLKKGNSIIFIEHNSQLLEAADFLVELGPGAGNEGGKLLRG